MRGLKHWFVPPVTFATGLKIRGIGIREGMPPGHVFRPTGTDDYMLMLFYDPVQVGVGEELMPFPPQSMRIWTPHCRQHYGRADGRYRHTWIHCDGTAVSGILAAAEAPLDCMFSLPDASLLEEGLQALFEELIQPGGGDGVIVRNMFENLVRRLVRRVRDTPERTAIPADLATVKRHIEETYAEPLGLSELAGMAHLSVPHFCSEFKRCFGTSAIDYAIRLRMHQAAYLLRDENLRVSEVGRRCGYDDIYYFSRVFKKHYGLSPTQMRQSMSAGGK